MTAAAGAALSQVLLPRFLDDIFKEIAAANLATGGAPADAQQGQRVQDLFRLRMDRLHERLPEHARFPRTIRSTALLA